MQEGYYGQLGRPAQEDGCSAHAEPATLGQSTPVCPVCKQQLLRVSWIMQKLLRKITAGALQTTALFLTH